MDLTNLDVVKVANEGSVLKLKCPIDFIDENGVTLFEAGDVLNDCKGKVAEGELKNQGKDFFVRLLGTDSDKYRTLTKRSLEKTFNAKDKKKKVDLDNSERETAEKFAKCTTECYFIENKKAIECTTSELTRVYLKYPWIREQVDAFMADRANFTKS